MIQNLDSTKPGAAQTLYQKNGIYPLTATFAGDLTNYVGSSDARSFKLQRR